MTKCRAAFATDLSGGLWFNSQKGLLNVTQASPHTKKGISQCSVDGCLLVHMLSPTIKVDSLVS